MENTENIEVDDDMSDDSYEDEPKWNQLFSALDSMLEKDKEFEKLKSNQLLKAQTADLHAIEEEPSLGELLNATQITPNIDNVLRYNHGCKKILVEMEKKLQDLLAGNRKKQEELEACIMYSNKRTEDVDDSSSNVKIKCVGMPYFKDKEHYLPPINNDVKKKESNKEPLPQYFLLRDKKDYHAKLEKLVVEQVRNSRIGKWKKKWNDMLEKDADNKDGLKAIEQEIQDIENKPSHLLNISSNEVDWMAISAKIREYSDKECEAKWVLECDPKLNKSRWKTAELDDLKKLAHKYKYQDWDTIADQLATNRTGYQCCKKYFSTFSSNEGKWTAEEDKKLMDLIRRYKIKNEIPWQKIAWHFDSRTIRQCRERYAYGLSSGKKGYFNRDEDHLIVANLKNCNNNFRELAKKVPGRTVKQVRARYDYLVGAHMDPWTEEETDLLIKLVDKHPKNWQLISQKFENRTALQCRKQWQHIKNDVRVEITSDDDFDWEDLDDFSKNLPPELIEKAENLENPKKGRKFEEINLNKKSELPPKSEAYDRFIRYLKTGHENSFGPKSRVFKNEAEEKKAADKMRLIMAMLSTDPGDLSSKLEEMDVMEDVDFNSEDRTILERLAEDPVENPTASLIFKNLIPPNYNTLVGLRSLLLGHKLIMELSDKNVPESSSITNPILPEDRLLFRDAKMRFQNRVKSLFALPSICSFTNPTPTEKITLQKIKKSKPTSKRKQKNLCKKMAENKALKKSSSKVSLKNKEATKEKSSGPTGKKRGRPTRAEMMKKKLEKEVLESQVDDPVASTSEIC